MVIIKLFWSFLQVGLFSIGGGYASLPLIQDQVVDGNGWLTSQEFVDVITISQMTPGPIALNAATFVGTKVAGLGGAVIATLGCVLPSLIIVLLLAFLYSRFRQLVAVKGILSGLRPAVVALIASAGISIFLLAIFQSQTEIRLKNVDYIAVALFVPSLVVLLKTRINPVYVMLADGALGGVLYLVL